MRTQFPESVPIALLALILTASFAAAQNGQLPLTIGGTTASPAERQHNRTTSVAELDRESAFTRVLPDASTRTETKNRRAFGLAKNRVSKFIGTLRSPSPTAVQSFGVGGGDIDEIEPNDSIAQGVSLPINVFGTVSFDADVDFFAFQARAGEQITVEPFAARLSRSKLIADIALFDSSGRLLTSAVGDENNDPLIRLTSLSDQVLIAGVTDADDLGGSRFDYVLNITRGLDVAEQEPNDRTAQQFAGLPVTAFGEISQRGDVDFYSFAAGAGQTLIVDVDAEVFGSQLDPEINLLDPETGVEYFYNDQHDGDDPRFNIVLPYTGRYVIGVGAFQNDSTGFYRLNASIVPTEDAPVIATVSRLAKKLIEVTGAGFTDGSVVEVNGNARRTTFLGSGKLHARVKAKPGNVVTISNPPDDRRSNPLVVQ
jgi:hypothetical protein